MNDGRSPAQPPPAPPAREGRRSLTALPTSEVVLRPSFVDALERVAPKKRRSPLWLFLLAVVVGLGAWLALSPAARVAVVGPVMRLVSGTSR